MHHSRLFDAWRMPIATAVSWFGCVRGGGEFVFYPEGPFGPAVALPAKHNTAIVLDTDSVFHAVDRVSEEGGEMPGLRPGVELVYRSDGAWAAEDEGRELALTMIDEYIRFPPVASAD